MDNAEVRALAAADGWTYEGDTARDPDSRAFYEAKWSLPGGLSVNYVADELVDARYLVVSGEDDARVREVTTRLAAEVIFWSLDELLVNFDTSVYPAEQTRSVLILGAGSPKRAADPVIMRILEATHHKDARVRRAAVCAMVYSEWPEYREPLAEMIVRETDAQVIHHARIAVQLFEEQ
ncbi:hypothetical protein D5S18_07455 [Nocardia panacis]|uniref:HEAT repeat domain-containing protein n=1 Tax=Nocardia panacis TaxID=2340916 RepID=A0A3A4KVP6_9NOCA|nr:hypothetical protein D5S18_07455 [Nocardia panacis]